MQQLLDMVGQGKVTLEERVSIINRPKVLLEALNYQTIGGMRSDTCNPKMQKLLDLQYQSSLRVGRSGSDLPKNMGVLYMILHDQFGWRAN